MNRKSPLHLALAAILIASPLPMVAQNWQPNSQNLDDMTAASVPGQQEAMNMVPAHVALTSTLNSQALQPGSQFRTRLLHAVRLSDGTKLRAGTMLVGQVVQPNQQYEVRAELALNFTQAYLKDGQSVPIKATIIGTYDSSEGNTIPNAGPLSPDQIPIPWTDGVLAVEQMGALSGVQLYSAIASPDSGVFVSNKRNDIKIRPDTDMTLAIAPAANVAQNQINEDSDNQQSPAGGK